MKIYNAYAYAHGHLIECGWMVENAVEAFKTAAYSHANGGEVKFNFEPTTFVTVPEGEGYAFMGFTANGMGWIDMDNAK